jgi:AraC-like DNA-binding protein
MLAMSLQTTRGEGWELAWRYAPGGDSPVRYFAGFSERLDQPRQTVEPASARSRLVIVVDGAMTVTSRPNHTQQVRSFVAGPRAAPVVVGQQKSLRGIEVGLSATAAASFIGTSMGELGEEIVPLDDVLGRRAGELHDRLASVTGWDHAFRILDTYLQPADGRAINPKLRWAWNTIEHAAGQVRIESVANEIGWSRRHFASSFYRDFGVTPKVAARLFRFERASRLLLAGLPSAQIAAVCGYFDQAHMHLDFAKFGTYTPGEITARRNDESLESSWPLVPV